MDGGGEKEERQNRTQEERRSRRLHNARIRVSQSTASIRNCPLTTTPARPTTGKAQEDETTKRNKTDRHGDVST